MGRLEASGRRAKRRSVGRPSMLGNRAIVRRADCVVMVMVVGRRVLRKDGTVSSSSRSQIATNPAGRELTTNAITPPSRTIWPERRTSQTPSCTSPYATTVVRPELLAPRVEDIVGSELTSVRSFPSSQSESSRMRRVSPPSSASIDHYASSKSVVRLDILWTGPQGRMLAYVSLAEGKDVRLTFDLVCSSPLSSSDAAPKGEALQVSPLPEKAQHSRRTRRPRPAGPQA